MSVALLGMKVCGPSLGGKQDTLVDICDDLEENVLSF